MTATEPAWPADAQPEQPCGTCKGALWVEDGEQDRAVLRTPGAGLVPCSACNEGNWESHWPYPGWPGRCREFSCDDATDPHPCSLFHDPTACERRVPLDGCGCDFDPAEVTTQIPAYVDEDEHPWCPNQYCHDRVHVDGTHTDENGRPFRGDEPGANHDTDDEADQWSEPKPESGADLRPDKPAGPMPEPFPLTPIFDQLVAERTYPELT